MAITRGILPSGRPAARQRRRRVLSIVFGCAAVRRDEARKGKWRWLGLPILPRFRDLRETRRLTPTKYRRFAEEFSPVLSVSRNGIHASNEYVVEKRTYRLEGRGESM